MPTPHPRPQVSPDRINELLSKIDAQTKRLDAASEALEHERAEIERQKQELLSLRGKGDTDTAPAQAENSAPPVGFAAPESAAPAATAQSVPAPPATIAPASVARADSSSFVALAGSPRLPKSFRGPAPGAA